MLTTPEKSADDRTLIVLMLQRKPLFADCEAQDLELFVEAMSLFVLKPGETVFEEGKVPQYLFVLAYGRLGLCCEGRSLGEVSRGDEVSMDSFLDETLRTTTTVATEDTGLWGIDKDTFGQLLAQFKREEAARLRTYLDSAPVFMGLTPEQKESLQEVMEILRLEADQLVVQQDALGDSCFIIKAGTVSCSKNGVEVRRLGPGDLFGEQALLYGGRRSATVRTVTASVLWKIELEDLTYVLGDHLDRVMYRNSIRIAFDGNPLLSRLSNKHKDRIISRMRIVTFNRGELGIEYKSKQLSVVLQGSLQSVTNPANTLQTFAILGDSAETNSPSRPTESFTVISDTAVIGCIDLSTLELRLQGSISSAIGSKPTPADLAKVPLFIGLNEAVIRSLVKYAIVRSFSPSEVIINEKDNGSALFVIVAGEVEVTQQTCSLRTLGELDYFGERALVMNTKRTATVTAKTDTRCWSFEKGRLPLAAKESDMKARFLARITLQDNTTLLSDLVVLKRIPKDVPGAPFLVVHSTQLEFYALQVVEKAALTAPGLRDFETEKQLLRNLYHPFLLRYVKSMEDQRFTYILTVYENGSDLFEVLRDFGRHLTEEEAKFYIACLILVVEFLHRRKVCIRNIKPENIQIDHSGYPLLSNLEYAKQLSEKTFTMVGAPHYMAPEMIKRKGYSLAVDYWSLGIMLYESLYGKVPFGEDEQSPMKVYTEILKAELTFPSQIHAHTRDVIASLLEPQPTRRANGSLSKLKKMPWFENTAWVCTTQDLLMTRRAKAPYQPRGKDLKQIAPNALAKGKTVKHALNVSYR